MLKIAPPEVTAFPALPERFPTNYVLDGMQRLSTLYGVFNFGSSTKDPRFNIYYDLIEGQFARLEDDNVPENGVPLSSLFVPRQLLEHQARLSQADNADELIDRLLKLQAAFQDYMVPVVTIKSNDVNRIVGIFEKINSTGTRLDPVDFMRAITWAEEFDLNHSLDEAAAILSEMRFTISSETIVKCVGMVLGIPPTTDGLLQMRSRTPQELQQAFAEAMGGIQRTSAFLKQNLHIESSNLVPYEGQLLLLFRTIGMSEASAEEIPAIVRWFWSSGFNEALRGKPDHYVVRAVENWRGLIAGAVRGLEPRLRLSPDDLFQRRLVSGAALTSTFVTMHANHRARSLATGEVINPTTYMSVPDMGTFEPIFNRADVSRAGFDNVISAKLFGNVLLMDDATRQQFGSGNIREAILAAGARDDWETLRSQFIDKESFAAIQSNDVVTTLYNRAYDMHSSASRLVYEG